MNNSRTTQPLQNPLEANLTNAENHVQLSAWLPPQTGVMPRIRIGQRWINILWAIPLTVVLLILAIAIAQQLRTMPAVQEFILRYPGDTSSRTVNSGFPLWLRLLHFFNLFFMMFIIRAGIQILADHPRLYWRRDLLRAPSGFASGMRFPRTPTGLPKMIQYRSQNGWASQALATRWGWPAGGTFLSISYG